MTWLHTGVRYAVCWPRLGVIGCSTILIRSMAPTVLPEQHQARSHGNLMWIHESFAAMLRDARFLCLLCGFLERARLDSETETRPANSELLRLHQVFAFQARSDCAVVCLRSRYLSTVMSEPIVWVLSTVGLRDRHRLSQQLCRRLLCEFQAQLDCRLNLTYVACTSYVFADSVSSEHGGTLKLSRWAWVRTRWRAAG